MTLKNGILNLGRRFADRNTFTDTCKIEVPGEQVWDEATLRYVPGPPQQVYPVNGNDGRCKLLSPYRAPTEANGQGQQADVELARLSLPVMESLNIPAGAIVTYLTSSSDPDLVDRKFTVAVGSQQSDTTARRIPVEEYS